MLFFNRLTAMIMVIAMVGPMLPLEARTRKGDKFLAQGRQHEERKEWDAALENYEQALSEDPSDVEYQISAQKARFEASALHVSNGVKIRAEGQFGEALLEFQKAYALSPSSTVAEQEIVRTQEMIQRERERVLATGKESPPEVRGLTPNEQAKKDELDRIDRMQGVPELKPLKPNLIDFKITNQTPKVLFETVAMYAGLNVVWDPDYQSPLPPTNNRLSVNFANSTIEEALDYLGVITKSYWKALSPNTIFITVDSANKRHDYEEQVTRVFYLTNITSATDLTEIVTSVRTIADCARLFPFQSQNAIVARCEGDHMALAEKIIHDLDKPRSEVVVDIYVMEASSVYARNLASGIATAGLNVPGNFTPRTSIQIQGTTATTTGGTGSTTSATTGSSVPLSELGHLASSDWSTVLPSALLQATLSDTRTKVLQSPQLRSVDGGKATMNIGEKEPTASGSFSSGVNTGTVSALVNTQFTYLDVGVNVEISPRVHDNGEISLHVKLDISQVTSTVNLGGIDEPVIGQRKVEHDIRLREGEVSMLGGLVNSQESKAKTGIPGLASIPILGRLFSADTTNRQRDELLIALVPHVVRRPDITEENTRAVASGNNTTIKISYAPKPGASPAGSDAPAVPAAPAVAEPAAVPAGLMPPATAPPENPEIPGAPPPAATARIRFNETQIDHAVGDTFTVSLLVDDGRDVAAAPLQIQFDPKLLNLTDVARGAFWTAGGEEPLVSKNLGNDTGSATVRLSRKPGSSGVTGAGALVTLTFKAVGRGAATIEAPAVTLTNTRNQLVGSASAKMVVNVK